MKRICNLVMLLTFCIITSAKNESGNWHVIPLPQEVAPQGGKPFKLTAKTVVYYDQDESVARTARFLQTFIHEMTGIEPRLQAGTSQKGIVLTLSSDITNEEGYRIEADQNRVKISAATPRGLFYGVQTLGKSLPVVKNAKAVMLPAVKVNDWPRFGFRGFLVDCGRHFFSVSYLKEVIDMLALHNINYFHWHLTEDQGWRIEIKKYPKLTEIGSYRKGTVIKQYAEEVDDIPVSGYYTQDEAREIVKYAADRFITVIPEVDMPGHSLAALASYPELGCHEGPYEIPLKFGIFKDVMNVGNPKVLEFAKDVLNEIMDIFPSPYIHIGGDECPKDQWKTNEMCQAKIKELGLRDTLGHSKEDQLQAYFIGELEKVIEARGRKAMGWDEILHGNAPKSTTVMAWTSFDAAKQAAKGGYKTIVCPISHFYFSNPRRNKLIGVESVEHVYGLNPIPEGLTPDQQKNIIGEQGCIWTEWTKDSVKMEWQMMPRIAALSENAWTMQNRKNVGSFLERLPHELEIYNVMGYCYKKDIFDVSVYTKTDKEKHRNTVTLKVLGDTPIYYTIDGSEPTTESIRYTGPFETDEDVKVKAMTDRSQAPLIHDLHRRAQQ